MKTAVADRIELAAAALAEGRVIQGLWRRQKNGRELVCALAAFGPDINGSADCPAELMPRWLASLVPVLDDGVAAADVPWFMGELVDRARQWHVLDDAAWDRVRTGFLISTVKQALASAEKVQPEPRPAYWQQVVDASAAVVSALESGDRKQLAEAAAAAAEAAAEARWAAAEARSLAERLFQLIDVEIDHARRS